MNPLVIAGVALRRLLRDRSNLFFVFIFPLLLVLLIGLQFGGGQDARVALVASDDPATSALADAIDAQDGLRVVHYADRDAAVEGLSRGSVSVVVVAPDGLHALMLAATPVLDVAYRPDAEALRKPVDAAVAAVAAPYTAARFAAAMSGRDPADLLESARSAAELAPRVAVVVDQVGADELGEEFAGLGQFDHGAATQLVLFVFLTSLAGSTALIESREFGVTRRVLSTPTSAGQVVVGEGLGRMVVALVQAAYIVAGTLLLFRVDWGDPLAASVVVLVFAAVSAGAATLLGAVSSNINQAGGLSVMSGLVLAALGGCMVPMEIFPDSVRTVAHVTPHAWANDAFAELIRRDGGLADIGIELGVLLGYAVLLWTLASWRLRRRLTA